MWAITERTCTLCQVRRRFSRSFTRTSRVLMFWDSMQLLQHVCSRRRLEGPVFRTYSLGYGSGKSTDGVPLWVWEHE